MTGIVKFNKDYLRGLVLFWNRSFVDKRHFKLITERIFSSRVLANRFFDPSGLLLLRDKSRVVGACHAIAADGKGYIPFFAVEEGWEDYRRALLERAETYLRELEPTDEILYAHHSVPIYGMREGHKQPLWGSTELMGLRTDEADLLGFLGSRGYVPAEHHLSLSLRKLEARDIELLTLKRNGLRPEYTGGKLLWDRPYRYPDGRIGWSAFGRKPYHNIRVLFLIKDNRAVGAAGWYSMRKRGWAALSSFWIDGSFRGKGLGKVLLEMTLNRMYSESFRNVELHTYPYNSPEAYKLYMKRGFRADVWWVSLKKTVLLSGFS